MFFFFFFHVLFAPLTIRSCFTVNSSPVKRPVVGRRPPRSNNGSHLGVARVFYWPWLLCEILTAISLLAKSDEATRETQTRTCCFKQPCRLPATPTQFILASGITPFSFFYQQQVDDRHSKTAIKDESCSKNKKNNKVSGFAG